MIMMNIDQKIARSEKEWNEYRYKNIGIRESADLFFGAVKRSLGKRIYCIGKTLYPRKEKTSFRSSYKIGSENIIVSLTSTADRIKHIFPTLYSLTCQTHKPDLIILWLGKNDAYPKGIVSRIKSLGVTVIFVEDLGPHTKYYYAFKKYKNDPVITVDDDIIYHRRMIEELYKTHLKNPDQVIARRVNKMRFDLHKKLLKYCDFIWEYRDAKRPSHDLLATGVGGVLYPAKILSLDCFDNRSFLEVSPGADDIWLKFMELSQDIKVCAVKDSKFFLDVINPASQKISLSTDNVNKGKNDECIRACTEYFGMNEDLCERMYKD